MSAEGTKLVKSLSGSESQASERIKSSIDRMMNTARARYGGNITKFSDGSIPTKGFGNIKGVEDYKLKTDVAKEVGKNLTSDKAAAGGVVATYQLTDKDVELYKEEQEARRLAEFDDWFLQQMAKVDVNKKQYMQSLYPELIERKQQQLEDEVELLVRNRLLSEFGPSSLEDYTMKFLMEKGLIDTPVVPKPGDPQFDGGLVQMDRVVPVEMPQNKVTTGGVYWDQQQHKWINNTMSGVYQPGILSRIMSGTLGKTIPKTSYNFGKADEKLLVSEIAKFLKLNVPGVNPMNPGGENNIIAYYSGQGRLDAVGPALQLYRTIQSMLNSGIVISEEEQDAVAQTLGEASSASFYNSAARGTLYGSGLGSGVNFRSEIRSPDV